MRKICAILSVLVLAILCVIILPADVNAAEMTASGICGVDGDNLSWVLDSEGTLTIFGSGAMKNYTSDSVVPWYKSRASIKKVIIEEGVTSIGNRAFNNCQCLTNVTMADSVTSIGERAFEGCCKLTSVTIASGMTSIGSYAFYECTNLTDVYIKDPSAWCRISFADGDANPMYYGNKMHILDADGNEVTSIVLDDTVTAIPHWAFKGCSGLVSVTIPNTVTSIGRSAFGSCIRLETITIPGSITQIADGSFHNCPSLTTVTIGDGVAKIGDSAFSSCTSLTSISIPDSVTSIAEHAFYECTSLTKATIGSGVTQIGVSAFDNCTSLTNVTFGAESKLPSIGAFAFSYCTSLTSITIPDSVTKINSSAFKNCTALTTVYYQGSAEEWKQINVLMGNDCLLNANIIYDYEGNTCNHQWQNATCTAPKTCTACGATEGSVGQHTYNNGVITMPATCKEEGVKTYTCTICNATKTEKVKKSTTHTYDNTCDTTCNVCGEIRTITHNYQTTWSKDGTNHWHECSVCRDKTEVAAHVPGPAATETTAQTCTVCGYEMAPALGVPETQPSAPATDPATSPATQPESRPAEPVTDGGPAPDYTIWIVVAIVIVIAGGAVAVIFWKKKK